MDQEVVTEVPQSMKRLVRLVVRGFYSIEHALVIDMLIRHPCMKEDDMIELLKFDRKQLRAVINTLKNEKFIKQRMRVETDSEGKTTRHNYYFISFVMFVNIVKYKLDHVRRKIEMEERDSTSRASFRCDECQKTFTDLEADQLFDFMTQTFRCTLCQNEVIEDESAIPKKDARTLLAKFNDQIQPLYDLLRECEDVKLAPELLEPEPIDRVAQRSRTGNKPGEGEKWSGDASKKNGFGYTESTIQVDLSGEDKKEKEPAKEQPLWMTHSTVDGVPMEMSNMNDNNSSLERKDSSVRSDVNREIETLLLIHEKKSNSTVPLTGNANAEESESSDSETETPKANISQPEVTDVKTMDSEDEEEEIVTVLVAGRRVPLTDVTDEMVAQMSFDEKSEYIRLGQELGADMYE